MIGKEIPWTFKKWMLKFMGVDLPIGDLAEDISRDPDFPDTDYFGDILDHLFEKCHGDPSVTETFSLAWGYYQASTADGHPSAL